MINKTMNIFITGAKGFIGTHLKEYINKIYKNYILFTPSTKDLDLYDENIMIVRNLKNVK